MELRQITKVAQRWWWLVAIPVFIVGAVTVATYRSPAPQYQIAMRFSAGTEPTGLSKDYDRYYPWLTSEYIANGLADVAVTGAFAQAVTEKLMSQGITVPANAIQGAIVSDNAQSIFVIYLTWPDPQQIIEVAEAITTELTENSSAYFPQLSSAGIVARRLDAPVPIALTTSLRAQLMGPALRLLLATAVGIGLASLAHYLDPTIHEPSELETLRVQVLSIVPPHKPSKGKP